MDGDCGVTILPGELVDGIPFEPRCLVLVLAAESERIMFDEMMAAGRKMSDPFFVEVNYSVALGSAPDVKTVGTNCGNSRVLLENYKRDLVGQDVRDALEETRAAITTQQELIAFWDHVQNSRAMVSIDPSTGLIQSVLPPSPSPPPPPPPVLHNAPPAPPEQVSNAVQTQRLADELVALELRRDALVASLDDCYVPDRPSGVVCGLSSQEAPDPWMALNGVKCRGYDTRSARERDFCGCVLLKNPLMPLVPSHYYPRVHPLQIGTRRSTPWPPTTSCASSCSRLVPTASPRAEAPSTARPMPRARSDRGFLT